MVPFCPAAGVGRWCAGPGTSRVTSGNCCGLPLATTTVHSRYFYHSCWKIKIIAMTAVG
ncbi:hypothetical protein KCP74_05710 [Salmonella enterica subsp. enterica]|nr:hypothetical protein KCP74_05710 [Salmonella enterica subsp. enterica]